jgi:hypothetical protein
MILCPLHDVFERGRNTVESGILFCALHCPGELSQAIGIEEIAFIRRDLRHTGTIGTDDVLPKNGRFKHWKPEPFEEGWVYAEPRVVHERDFLPLRDKACEYNPISGNPKLGHLVVDSATLIKPTVAANEHNAVSFGEIGVSGHKFKNNSAILAWLQGTDDDHVRLNLAKIAEPLRRAYIFPIQVYAKGND